MHEVRWSGKVPDEKTYEAHEPEPKPKVLGLQLVKSVPGDKRNEKCPCGSLRKAKNCHCTKAYMVLPSSVSAQLRNILT